MIQAGYDGHSSIDKLALMIALDVPLDSSLEEREDIDKARQALMPNDVLISIINVLYHPVVCMRPAILVAAEVGVHDVDLRPPRSQPTQSKKKDFLRVDSVAAGSAIGEMACWEGKLVLHWLELALEIERRVQTTELTMIEVSHLVRGNVGEVIDLDTLCTGELQRSILLLRRDVKEEAVCSPEGMQHAGISHEYSDYGLDGSIQHIIVDVAYVRCCLKGKEDPKKLRHCRAVRRKSKKHGLNDKFQVIFSRTEMQPARVWRNLALSHASASSCLGAAFATRRHGEEGGGQGGGAKTRMQFM